MKAAKTALTSLDGVDSVIVTLKDKTAVIVTKPGKTLTKEVVEAAVKNSKDGLSVKSFEQVNDEPAKTLPEKEEPKKVEPPKEEPKKDQGSK